MNPQGCQVHSFRQPSEEEIDHTFLWRCMRVLPERGQIGVFNRSHYEEVLVVRVHPELLDRQRLPSGIPRRKELWRQRYDDINAFEQHLDRNGTKIVKVFLHLSKKEQKQRFLARLDDPAKNWKFSMNDLDERAKWTDYREAYDDALSNTSTAWAPWWVVPADRKPVTRMLVAAIIVEQLRQLNLSFPTVNDTQRAELEEARRRLLAEQD